MKLYGKTVTCTACGSNNVVERWRESTLPSGVTSEYPVAVCLTCGGEMSL